MRQVKVLLVGFLIAVALAATLHAQNYVWSSINGIPYAPGLVLSPGTVGSPALSFAGDTDTGIYSGIAGSLSLVTDGTPIVRVSTTSLYVGAPGAHDYHYAYLHMMYQVLANTGAGSVSDAYNQNTTLFTNEGDADGASVTLPTALAGLNYSFCIQAAQTLTITANAGDTIRLASAVTAAAGSISSNVVGSCVTLVAINATEWYATSIVGSWSY